jgi:diguanylate cyclase (GGDEF)-like protein/PAS domain S-box-containing protein
MARAGLGQPPDAELRQRLATQLAVTAALRSAAPGDAVDAVLERICLGLEWDLGVVWIEDAVSRELVCGGLWQPPARPLGALAADIRTPRSGPLTGLAEAARDSRTATWLSGRGAAGGEGVKSGVAVAVAGGGRVIGVLEFFGRRRRAPDSKLGELLEGFGLQLGEAIARDEAVRWARSVEARRSVVFDAAPDPVVSVDADGRVTAFNRAAEEVFGHPRSAAIGREIIELLIPERLQEQQRARFLHRLASDRVSVLGRRFESIAVRADGSELPVELTIARAEIPGQLGLTIYLRDISASRRAERAMRNLAAIVESSDDAILSTTLDGTILTWNRGAESLYGYPASEAIGRSIEILAEPIAPDEMVRILDRVRRGESIAQVEAVRRRKDGSLVDVQLTVSPVVGADGRIVGASVIARDISLQKRAQEQIAHLAYHDQLTGLPNRAMFYQHLELAIARADRNGFGVAVLFVDLDSFKLVNDSFGHLAGDGLLRDFATRLRAVTRATDIVARQGGDEFLVLVPDLELAAGSGIEPSALDVVQTIEAKVRSVLDTPFDVAGTAVHVGLSIGVSIYPLDARDRDQLLRNADTAMYIGKGLADDPPQLEQAGSRGRLALIARLRNAVDADQFELHYQPIVELASGNLVGVEALLRWRDPGHGLVLPGEFIPLAERSGMIEPITRWVIDSACQQAREWSDHDLDLVVTFNLPPSLWGPAIVETLIEATHRAGVEPHRIMIEITESTAMVQPGRARQTLAALREHGVRLAIDDFGTGYSSLGRLHQLPVSTLKIDRSFVSALPHDPGAAAIVQSIVQLAHSLGLQPLAEGIETEAQLRFLVEHGCDLGQGFLLGRPMVPSRIEALAVQP